MVPLKPTCKATGFVVMALGAPLLVFITVWSLRQGQLLVAEITTLSRGKHGNTAEHNLNQVLVDVGTTDHMGPIQYFEVWMVPPSYLEAVSKSNTEANSDEAFDELGFNLEKMSSEPPSYEESCININARDV